MWKSLAVVAAGTCVATGASAQQNSNASAVATESMRFPNADIDREYESKMRLSGGTKAQKDMATAIDSARCLAKSAKAKAGELVGGPMTDDESLKRLSRGLSGKYRNCAPSTDGVPLILISGALAEELVREKRPALQSRAVPADLASAKAFYATSGGITIDSLGRCLAVYSPGLAYQLLSAGVGSRAESEALRQLYAQTPECGVRATPKDIPMTEQRSAVATGLYYWLQKG
jgi:hypothetical protein